MLKAADIWVVDEQFGRQAGRLLGRAGDDNTVDAVVAATAVAACERLGAARCLVLTSDPGDLRRLLSDSPQIRVAPV